MKIFSENMQIVGHQIQRKILESISVKETIPQSYLFVGPNEIGKKQVAIEFAFRLIGQEIVLGKQHPDICVVESKSEERGGQLKKKQIAVADVRKALFFLSRFPTLGKRRVVIIDNAEDLSLGGQNALLKVLEEPNTTSILILVTAQPGRLLPTLLSRLVPFSFDPVPSSELEVFFRERTSLPPQFFFLLGLPGLISKAICMPENFQLHQKRLSQLFRISTLSLRDRLKLAEELSNDQDTLPVLLGEWLTGLHIQFLQGDSARFQKKILLLERILKGNREIILRRGNARLVLENLFLAL